MIKDTDLLQKVKDTLRACTTPIKLEDRRKYAPLTPAGHDRPKLLAYGNGLISVEPTFRKTLSQGTLVKGSSLTLFDNKLPPIQGMAAVSAKKAVPVPANPEPQVLDNVKENPINDPHKRSSPFKRDMEKIIKNQNIIGMTTLFHIQLSRN